MITVPELYSHLTKNIDPSLLIAKYYSNPKQILDIHSIISQTVENKTSRYTHLDDRWAGDLFSSFFNYLEIFQVSLIGSFILLIALFFPRSGRFTRFLNKLSFEYIVLVLFLNTFDIVLRPYKISNGHDYVLKNIGSFDSIYLNESWVSRFINYANITQSELLFTKIFIWFSLIALAITFYGLADRFFIANSYDIEFTLLVFLIYIGSVILFLANNLIEFVLALEVITLGSYGLAAYERKSKFSSYSGVQYFIIGSIPSGMLVFSLALMYKAWGTLALADIDVMLNDMFTTKIQPTISPLFNETKREHAKLLLKGFMTAEELANPANFYTTGSYQIGKIGPMFAVPQLPSPPIYVLKLTHPTNLANHLVDWYSLFGTSDSLNNMISNAFMGEKQTEMLFALFLVVFNLFFKITAAPFNFWAPSVYGNAPVSSATFLSIFSKLAVVFALIKVLLLMFAHFQEIFLSFLLLVGIFSVIFGMAGAFAEKTIKRFYVYSSMGHVGFMVVALAISSTTGYAAVFHYLFVYVLSSYLMWFVLIVMGRSRNNLVHFGSLKNIDKWVATAFALLVFSMSGIPPLGGFFVKLDVLIALLDSSQYYVNFLLLFFSVISFFYYLRLIKIIYFDERKDYVRDIHISEERLWMIAILFIILLFYMFIVHKPLLVIERESLSALLNN